MKPILSPDAAERTCRAVEDDLSTRRAVHNEERAAHVAADGKARFDAWLASMRAAFDAEAGAAFDASSPAPTFEGVADALIKTGGGARGFYQATDAGPRARVVAELVAWREAHPRIVDPREERRQNPFSALDYSDVAKRPDSTTSVEYAGQTWEVNAAGGLQRSA